MPSQVSSRSWAALQRTSPAVHSTQAPFAQWAGATQVVPFCHWPFMAHVCGVSGEVGLQRGASPGVQTQQSPLVQPSGQVAVIPQCPLLSQTWLVLGLEHRLAGGTQSLQSLLVHAAHTTGLPQVPVASQVSKLVPLQRVLLGVQSTQWGGGSKHTLGHAAPSFVHIPVLLQTCGCWLEHRWAPGAQGAQLPMTQTGFGLAQAAPFTHCPMLLQVRGVLPLQSLLFGMQAPPHMPMLQTLGHTMPLLIQCPVVSQSCG